MRSVGEYLAVAAEFDDMANATSLPALHKRYSDLAECYRLLAYERQRLIDGGISSRKELEPVVGRSIIPGNADNL